MKQQINLQKCKSEFRGSILEWNLKYPFDYMWRRKYNIPFASEAHLAMNFFDMKFDLDEEQMFAILSDSKVTKEDKNQALKLFLDGVSKQDIDKQVEKDFDELDINEINKMTQNGGKNN